MSPAYRAHPEFGYLCPSRGFRRAMWTALAVAGFGTLAGAFVLGGGHDARDDRAALLASVDAAPSGIAAKPATETATAARPRPPERGKAACEGGTWTYLDGKCVAGRAHAPRTAAAIDSPPIAAIPLGRSAPPPPEPARAIEPAAPAAPAEPERADAAATAPEAATPGGQSTSMPKARKKAARGRSGSRELAGVKGSPHGDRQMSASKSTPGRAKQLRAGEQLMRALFFSSI